MLLVLKDLRTFKITMTDIPSQLPKDFIDFGNALFGLENLTDLQLHFSRLAIEDSVYESFFGAFS